MSVHTDVNTYISQYILRIWIAAELQRVYKSASSFANVERINVENYLESIRTAGAIAKI